MPFDAHASLAAAALHASRQGVLVLDPEGVVVACNPAAAALLDRPTEELEGALFPLLPATPGLRRVPLADGGMHTVEIDTAETEWEGQAATVVSLRETDGSGPDILSPADPLRAFVEHARGVFFVASMDARILHMGPGIEEILGRPHQEVTGADELLAVVHPDDRTEVGELLRDPDRAPYEITYRVIRPDGTVRWLRQRSFPAGDAGRPTDRVVGMLDDVTEEKEERELLSHTLRLLRRTVSSLQEGVLVVDTTDRKGRILSVNPAVGRIFGYPGGALVGESMERLHPDSDSFRRFEKEAMKALRAGEVFQATSTLKRADGAHFPAEQTLAWLDPDDQIDGGVVAVIRDLSDQHRAEAELRASEERFRLIAEHIDDVFWISSVDKEVMEYVSPAYEKVWGRPVEEVYRDADHWVDHLVDEDRERVMAALPRQALGTYEEEYRIRRSDGEIRWIWDRAFPVKDADGEVVRIIGVAEDITERKRAEERFGVLSREITDILYVLGADGEVRFTSPSVRHTLGYAPEEFQGSDILALVDPEDRDRVRGQLREIQNGGGESSRAQYRMRTKGGETLHVESIARNLLDNPAVEGIVVTTRDVTERLELEEQLLQSQKMEAVGRLAGGIAHDFNNLLTVIRAQTDLLLLDLEEESPLRADIETIQATGDRAADLTSQLLAFSRDQVLRPLVVDLSEVVRGMGTLLDRIIGEDIRVVNRLPEGLPPVRVDPRQLEHVIMNLAINARDAMPRGGTLTLATSLEPLGRDDAETLGLESGEYVALRVADTGVGMDEETRLRIFEPFFTTKPTGEGTGLGLAMAHGVVFQSGGDIQVESTPGEGTTFTLRFPAVDEEEAVSARVGRTSRPLEAHAASGTILVVEDDGDVRRATTRILERGGHTVRAVERAEAAMEVLDGGAAVDLILTDLVLPGMNGRALVDRVRRERPELPIVVMSGYAAGSPGQPGDLPADVAFIQKPFDPVELVRTIRDALESVPDKPR